MNQKLVDIGYKYRLQFGADHYAAGRIKPASFLKYLEKKLVNLEDLDIEDLYYVQDQIEQYTDHKLNHHLIKAFLGDHYAARYLVDNSLFRMARGRIIHKLVNLTEPMYDMSPEELREQVLGYLWFDYKEGNQ